MSDEPVPEPEDLAELRHVTVWARNPNGWNLEVSYPDWMSPYEAHGMLRQATKNMKEELAAHQETAEEATDED